MSSPARGSAKLDHVRVEGARSRERSLPVVIEEPLEMRLNEQPVAVTMRTPGHDIELVLGFLVSEGIVEDPAAVLAIAHCEQNPNVAEVRTQPDAPGVHPPVPRNFYAASSCGICGKASLEAIRLRTSGVHADTTSVSRTLLTALPERMRGAQTLFEATGSLHAAGLFTAAGELLCLREDVGRHNAVDKVVGWAAARELLPLQGHVLVVSGRLSFEIVQKALVAGIPILAAVSGPSSLAVELARENGMTLIGFLRGETLNIYSAAKRVELR